MTPAHIAGSVATVTGSSAVGPELNLGEVDAEGVRDLATRVRLFDDVNGEDRPSPVVERAIVCQRVLEIAYRDKDGETSRRAVEPVAVLGVRYL